MMQVPLLFCLVKTRHLTGAFLGHATTALMVDTFMDKCCKVNFRKMIQLSMDGLNVNWAFYTKMMAEIHERDGPEFYRCFTSVVQLLHFQQHLIFSSLCSPIWNCPFPLAVHYH